MSKTCNYKECPYESKSKFVVYLNHIDNRIIKCACGNPKCKIGINSDSDPNILFLTDKYGKEHAMHLNKENTKELISLLKSFKFN